MANRIHLTEPLHLSTKRDYLARMNSDKVKCSEIARRFDKEFFDGDRSTGYGGYKYDGRWKSVAEQLIDRYGLKDGSRVLDVGCGKGFLLYEIYKINPKIKVIGFDVSEYAVSNGKEEVKDRLFVHDAKYNFPILTNEFDLVISLMTLHNLLIGDLIFSLSEIERVGKNKFITVESYRNEQELFNLQCWAFTCESFFRPEEWEWIFNTSDYQGDYELLFFN